MEFNQSLDKLSKVVKVILAIIPPLYLIWLVYAIIRDQKNATLIILDLVFSLLGPLGLVFWIGNIVTLVTKDEVLSFGAWVKGDPVTGSSKENKEEAKEEKEDEEKKDEAVEAEVVDK